MLITIAAASTSKSYILRSTLASELIENAAREDDSLREKESLVDEEEEDENAPQTFGTILSWCTTDQIGGLGLLYVILALILVSGHVLSDRKTLSADVYHAVAKCFSS